MIYDKSKLWKLIIDFNEIIETVPQDPSVEEKSDCKHDYVLYNGLKECYYFCTRCDHKKY